MRQLGRVRLAVQDVDKDRHCGKNAHNCSPGHRHHSRHPGFFMHASGSIQAGNRKKTTVFHKKDSCISEKRQSCLQKNTVMFP